MYRPGGRAGLISSRFVLQYAAMKPDGQGSVSPGQNRASNFRRRPRRVPPPKDPTVVGFLCDVMLARLARELRVLGLDVECERNLGGMAAYRVARQRGRILLTRANRLRELEGVLFVPSTAIEEQVAQVKAALDAGLKPPVPVEMPREAGPDKDEHGRAPTVTDAEPAHTEPEPPPIAIPSGMPIFSLAISPAPAPEPEQTTPVIKEPEPERPPARAEPVARPRAEPRQQQRPRREERPPVPPPPQPTAPMGRCIDCNVPLEHISREQARPSVPFFIYQIHYEFGRCPKCKKVFWPGDHVAQMQQRIPPQPGARRRRPPSGRSRGRGPQHAG